MKIKKIKTKKTNKATKSTDRRKRSAYEIYLEEVNLTKTKRWSAYGNENLKVAQPRILTKAEFEFELEQTGKKDAVSARKLAKSLIKEEDQWSLKQRKALMDNINLFIIEVWSLINNKTTLHGRRKKGALNLGAISGSQIEVYNIMVEFKGDNKPLSDYLVTMSDLLSGSYYFKMLYDILRNIVSSVGDLYAS